MKRLGEEKKMTEEQKHDHIKEIAEDYVSKSWNTFLDLEEIDLVMAGIGVGKIIASEQEKRIEELEAQIKKMKSDVRASLEMADQNNNCLMYLRLNYMLNQWEGKEKEND